MKRTFTTRIQRDTNVSTLIQQTDSLPWNPAILNTPFIHHAWFWQERSTALLLCLDHQQHSPSGEHCVNHPLSKSWMWKAMFTNPLDTSPMITSLPFAMYRVLHRKRSVRATASKSHSQSSLSSFCKTAKFCCKRELSPRISLLRKIASAKQLWFKMYWLTDRSLFLKLWGNTSWKYNLWTLNCRHFIQLNLSWYYFYWFASLVSSVMICPFLTFWPLCILNVRVSPICFYLLTLPCFPLPRLSLYLYA